MDLTNIKKAFTDLVGWSRQGFADTAEATNVLAEGKANMITGRFVASQAEFDATKNAPPNQGEVFNSWYRFSHLRGNPAQPAIPDELGAWVYDSASDTIRNTTNSTSYIGVVSKSRYDKYLLDVFIDSTDNDDDSIAIVLAWHVDPITKKENTISAIRSPGGNGINTLWSVLYNYQQDDSVILSTGNTTVTWGNGQPGSMSSAQAEFPPNVWNWSKMEANYGAAGNRIKAERDQDIIRVQTAQWGTPNVIDPNTLLTIDLTTNPLLEKFRGPRAYGFSSQSQAYSSWRVDNFTNPQDRIYNLKDNQVFEYVDDDWALVPGATISDLGERAILYNPITKKMFYLHDPGSIVRMDTSDL